MSSRNLLVAGMLVALMATWGIPSTVWATSRSPDANSGHGENACGPVAVGFARCAVVVLDDHSTWRGRHVRSAKTGSRSEAASATPPGYGPADLQSAYGLTAASSQYGQGKTVAIVDAYDDPKAAADLSTYRSTEGLPALCDTPEAGAGCVGSFEKLNQTGGVIYPKANEWWTEEISVDLDMVSGICPLCNIVLVEATTSSELNLAIAQNEAALLGASAISDSYYGHEFPGERALDPDYDHPGVAIAVAAGDQGFRFGASYPAASPYVTAVGGTSLINSGTADNPNWNETVWEDSGSGCSAYEPAPSWQFVSSTCSHRTIADVAAVADPGTGVAAYDTYESAGWIIGGGTSVATAIIASIYALANSGTTPVALYGHAPTLRPVATGMNSHHCKNHYLCDAADSLSASYTYHGQSYNPTWYNGPTGNGSPQGISGF
jgi:subtilase family serine protease